MKLRPLHNARARMSCATEKVYVIVEHSAGLETPTAKSLRLDLLSYNVTRIPSNLVLSAKAHTPKE